MVNVIKWIDPDSAFGWTHIRIERGSAEAGPFTELTSSDISGYVDGTGLPLGSPHVTEAKDITGSSGHYYRIRFFDGTNYSDYSDAMVAFDYRGYCTIDEVRASTNVQETEYPDGQLQLIIDGVTAEIEHITGRTWKEVETETSQVLDGTGEALLTLPQGDIQSITALAVDTDMDGVYDTTIDVSSEIFIYYAEGVIRLNTSSAPLKVFPDKPQCVEITYTYGNATPTHDVRHLALLMVANTLCIRPEVTEMIKEKLKLLSRRSFQTV